jgi:hypothetical protein
MFEGNLEGFFPDMEILETEVRAGLFLDPELSHRKSCSARNRSQR